MRECAYECAYDVVCVCVRDAVGQTPYRTVLSSTTTLRTGPCHRQPKARAATTHRPQSHLHHVGVEQPIGDGEAANEVADQRSQAKADRARTAQPKQTPHANANTTSITTIRLDKLRQHNASVDNGTLARGASHTQSTGTPWSGISPTRNSQTQNNRATNTVRVHRLHRRP